MKGLSPTILILLVLRISKIVSFERPLTRVLIRKHFGVTLGCLSLVVFLQLLMLTLLDSGIDEINGIVSFLFFIDQAIDGVLLLFCRLFRDVL